MLASTSLCLLTCSFWHTMGLMHLRRWALRRTATSNATEMTVIHADVKWYLPREKLWNELTHTGLISNGMLNCVNMPARTKNQAARR